MLQNNIHEFTSYDTTLQFEYSELILKSASSRYTSRPALLEENSVNTTYKERRKVLVQSL